VLKELTYHQLWTKIDDFGGLVGVKRFLGENNIGMYYRVLNAAEHPGNSTEQGLVDSISRDLGLDRWVCTSRKFYELSFLPENEGALTVAENGSAVSSTLFDVDGSTLYFNNSFVPSGPLLEAQYSYWDGFRSRVFVDIWSGPLEVWNSDTPTIKQVQLFSLSDPDYLSSLMPSGTSPGTKLETFARQLQNTVGEYYEHLQWDHSNFFDDRSAEKDKYLETELPHVWSPDNTGIPNGDYRSGVGSMADLVPIVTIAIPAISGERI
jgi:hypothetical protein